VTACSQITRATFERLHADCAVERVEDPKRRQTVVEVRSHARARGGAPPARPAPPAARPTRRVAPSRADAAPARALRAPQVEAQPEQPALKLKGKRWSLLKSARKLTLAFGGGSAKSLDALNAVRAEQAAPTPEDERAEVERMARLKAQARARMVAERSRAKPEERRDAAAEDGARISEEPEEPEPAATQGLAQSIHSVAQGLATLATPGAAQSELTPGASIATSTPLQPPPVPPMVPSMPALNWFKASDSAKSPAKSSPQLSPQPAVSV
jgi:hypothetical protein